MLIADFGYGLLIVLLALYFLKKFKEQGQDLTTIWLFLYLGSGATIWGWLSGNCFGRNWLSEYYPIPFPWLADHHNLQFLCFAIGTTHLSIAHIWKGLADFPKKTFLSEIGWVCILWSMFFLICTLVLGMVYDHSVILLLVLGSGLVIAFSSPQSSHWQSIYLGLGQWLMNIINMFGDIISYIRLFAIGLATVAVADAFNGLAMPMFDSSALSFIIGIFILILGHGLNLLLAAMAVIVHGVRLNVLEFSRHLNMEWKGEPYRPFQYKNIVSRKTHIEELTHGSQII